MIPVLCLQLLLPSLCLASAILLYMSTARCSDRKPLSQGDTLLKCRTSIMGMSCVVDLISQYHLVALQ